MNEFITLFVITILVVSGLLVGGFVLWHKLRVHQELLQSHYQQYEIVMDRAIQAEIELDKVQQHYNFLKAAVDEFSKKPVMATMNAQQMQEITQAIMVYAESINKSKSQAN